MRHLRPQITIPDLASCLECELDELKAIAARPAPYYRNKIIHRRKKQRLLRVPDRRLRRIQKNIYRHILKPWVTAPKLHPSAACARGRGVVWAARRHARHACFFHGDLEDFYPSVTLMAVRDALARLGYPQQVARFLASLLTIENELPQGGTCSPALGEIVLYPLDIRLAGLANQRGFTYTRYADDIAFSGGQRLRPLEPLIRRIVADCGWRLNDKGGMYGVRERHSMLGMVVNTKPNVSANYRRDLYYALKAASRRKRPLNMRQYRRLAGRVQWLEYVNPTGVRRHRQVLDTLSVNATADA